MPVNRHRQPAIIAAVLTFLRRLAMRPVYLYPWLYRDHDSGRNAPVKSPHH